MHLTNIMSAWAQNSDEDRPYLIRIIKNQKKLDKIKRHLCHKELVELVLDLVLREGQALAENGFFRQVE